MEDKKDRADKNLYAYYVEVESGLDLARQAFGYGHAHIKAIKEGKSYRLICTGEKIGKLRMLYYTDIDKIGGFMVYEPESESGERIRIKETVTADATDYRSFRAPIIELLSNPYMKTEDFKKAGNVMKVEIKDPNALVKAIAGYANEEDTMPKLYAFFDGKDHIIGTFEIIRESDVRIFAYAKIQISESFGALSYNYTNDTVQPAKSFAEKLMVYIRIINLKKPFPFF